MLAAYEAETTERARARGAAAPARRCLVTRETLPTHRLVRFVVGPDQRIVPDVEGRLPGRGLWLQATRGIVDKACAAHVFAKAARAPVSAEQGLADRVEQLLARRCLDLVGLARRAGMAVAGYEKAMAQVRQGGVGVVLVARDAAEGGRGRVAGAASGAPVLELFSSAELGSVFGRERTVHVAVADCAIARRLVTECARLAGFRPAREMKDEG